MKYGAIMKWLIQIGKGSLCAVTFWLVYEILSSVRMVYGVGAGT